MAPEAASVAESSTSLEGDIDSRVDAAAALRELGPLFAALSPPGSVTSCSCMHGAI